jgi:hypothetical protein
MPNPENLEGKGFKKGQSGNPKGRPKGSRNRSTLAKQWLEVNQKVKNPITGEQETLEQQDIMTLALIKKARSGDVAAYKELMDSAYGKALQKTDITTDGEKIAAAPDIKVYNTGPKLSSSEDEVEE